MVRRRAFIAKLHLCVLIDLTLASFMVSPFLAFRLIGRVVRPTRISLACEMTVLLNC